MWVSFEESDLSSRTWLNMSPELTEILAVTDWPRTDVILCMLNPCFWEFEGASAECKIILQGERVTGWMIHPPTETVKLILKGLIISGLTLYINFLSRIGFQLIFAVLSSTTSYSLAFITVKCSFLDFSFCQLRAAEEQRPELFHPYISSRTPHTMSTALIECIVSPQGLTFSHMPAWYQNIFLNPVLQPEFSVLLSENSWNSALLSHFVCARHHSEHLSCSNSVIPLK